MYKTARLISLFILLAVILMQPTQNVSAALVHCRTDPVFLLSNLDTVNVTLDIDTDAANVRNMNYILHIPAGVTVIGVIYTDGNLGKKEAYKVYQDSPTNTYTTDTVVTTQNAAKVAVVATTQLNLLKIRSASGYSAQHLIITVSNTLLKNIL
jgi:hypothetical protein